MFQTHHVSSYQMTTISWTKWKHWWHIQDNPDSKIHGANMGPIWGRQDPGGPHVGPMSFAIWEDSPHAT